MTLNFVHQWLVVMFLEITWKLYSGGQSCLSFGLSFSLSYNSKSPFLSLAGMSTHMTCGKQHLIGEDPPLSRQHKQEWGSTQSEVRLYPIVRTRLCPVHIYTDPAVHFWSSFLRRKCIALTPQGRAQRSWIFQALEDQHFWLAQKSRLLLSVWPVPSEYLCSMIVHGTHYHI